MEMTLDQALQKGIEAHKAGQVQEADKFYTAILQSQPLHPDANHNMGVLAVGIGKAQEALPFFKTAVEANPSLAQFWLSYIDALIRLNKNSDAAAVLDQAKGNGIKGEAFDQLERSINELDGSNRDTDLKKRPTGEASKIQDPPPEQLQSLINLYSQGQHQQALNQAAEMLEQFPRSAILYNMCGAAQAGSGKLDAAIESYKFAVQIRPDFAEAYNNMGNALHHQGSLAFAIDSYKQALEIDRGYADAHYNMGNALRDQGNLAAAIVSYKHAIEIKPSYAEARNNMGGVLQEQGNVLAAIDSYKQAIKINPDHAEAHNNMGYALTAHGDLAAAIESYKRALDIKPDYADAHCNMGNALAGIVFSKSEPELEEIITRLLASKTLVNPANLVSAAISLLKCEPIIKGRLQRHPEGGLEQPLNEIVSGLGGNPLFLKLLTVCSLNDLEFEAFLIDVRSSILASISEMGASSEELKLQSALALQLFINEYIYSISENEYELLKKLELSVSTELSSGKQPSPNSLLCLASYKALNNYEWVQLISVCPEIESVFTQQVVEPAREHYFKSTIQTLEEITHATSSKVKEQYETNPYPRWVKLGLSVEPLPISRVVSSLNLDVFDSRLFQSGSLNVLVAGCGTGQHSIVTASRFENSKVLAVDLSLASLSYAKRKTEELKIQNINYMQADILDLGKLNRKFDVIECGGVLHHMHDPMNGWRALVECLEPGGLMKIGLYSESARKEIVKIKQDIRRLGSGSSVAEMKSYRCKIIDSDKEEHIKIRAFDDFYSLSMFRDLLFHVQEHRFSLPQIQGCLVQLGLVFCGFESDGVVQDFKRTYTGLNDPYDLDKWHSYEQANPYIFASMYQFWCQKVL